MTEKRTDLYKQLKVASLLCLLPFVLGIGPFGGFYLGSYLQEAFGMPSWVTPGLVIVGILAAALEAWRIIKMAIRVGE